MTDAHSAQIKDLKERADRRDHEVNKQHTTLWEAVADLRERVDRWPVSATMVFAGCTTVIGLLSGWLAKAIFN